VITQLNLVHFKCFDLLKLPLEKLTLLSGSNASGKSSVLQSLVLLHQTMNEHEWAHCLMLNGTAIKLGTLTDVIDKVNGRLSFQIGLSSKSGDYQWTFIGEDRADMSLRVASINENGKPIDKIDHLQYLIPYDLANADYGAPPIPDKLRRLTYITAERIGPREFYPLEDGLTATVVGPKGEYAISVLHSGRDKPVLDSLAIAGIARTRLRQVEARMQQFFPGCGLEVQQIPNANAVTLGLRTSTDTDFHRPIHVGFGLTQVLPIIIAALSAKEDDILLIENPEVHLHPAGQALMGQFLAEVAQSGVQVIVETHSDHVLNGVRRAVKAKKLSPEQLAIHFFRPRSADMAQVVSPQIDANGNIDSWPDGFFDQFDKDMNHFAGWD
jgi:predicted ATPase